MFLFLCFLKFAPGKSSLTTFQSWCKPTFTHRLIRMSHGRDDPGINHEDTDPMNTASISPVVTCIVIRHLKKTEALKPKRTMTTTAHHHRQSGPASSRIRGPCDHWVLAAGFRM